MERQENIEEQILRLECIRKNKEETSLIFSLDVSFAGVNDVFSSRLLPASGIVFRIVVCFVIEFVVR